MAPNLAVAQAANGILPSSCRAIDTNAKLQSMLPRSRSLTVGSCAVVAALLAVPYLGLAADTPRSFDDWALRCDDVELSAPECHLSQNILRKDSAERVLLVSIGYPQGAAVPIALMTTPLGIYLPTGITVQVDDGEPMHVELERCNEHGCHAGLTLDPTLVEQFRRGRELRVTMHDGSGRRFHFPVSLRGFRSGFAALRDSLSAP